MIQAHLDASSLAIRDLRRQNHSKSGTVLVAIVGIGTIVGILALICTILVKGIPAVTWEFISQPPTDGMKAGGIWPMIRGSILLMGGTVLIVLPIGILGGVCLAEYAGDTRFARILRSCVVALAGTPSVIYGLFGLAVFVLMFDMGISLLAGWCTLAIFSLPVIVLTTDQAIKAVPGSFLDAGVALGLSKWQALSRITLPSAMPSILTGVMLSIGRAAGEAPPILLTAGIYYSSANLALSWQTLSQPVANLPYHLAEGYRQGGIISEKNIWGTCLVLMSLVLLINLTAIIVRARARSKQMW